MVLAILALAASVVPLSATTWRRSIVQGYAAGRREFVLAPGTYRLSDPAGDFYVELAGLSGVRLKGDGVTLLLPDPGKGGMRFSDCRNLSLSGFTIRHDPLPFTQGKIVAISADRRSYTVRVANGYPADMDNPKHFPARPTGYVFDPATRQWKRGTYDLSFASVARVGDRTFQFDLSNPVPQSDAVNDLMAFRGVGRQMIILDHCASTEVENVTVQASGGFGLQEDGGDGDNHYRGYKVTYPPKPDGADEAPLMSNGADAFHSSGVKVGPKLENCLLEGMPDDGIAIHGMYAQVAACDGRRLVVGTIYGVQADVGDTYRLYDPKGNLKGEATITAVSPDPGFAPPRKSSFAAFSSPKYFDVTLDHPIGATFDWLAASKQHVGSGFVLRNNVIRNNRARGILIKASDGLIEGNTVDGSTIAGILVAPEAYWMEADFARNLQIRNNLIRNTGYATAGSWSFSPGGLSIVADGFGAKGNRNILVQGNTFENIDGVNLLVANADGVQISGNRFQSTQLHPTSRGGDYGIDTGALIWVSRSSNVALSRNVLQGTKTPTVERVVYGPDVDRLTSDWTATGKR